MRLSVTLGTGAFFSAAFVISVAIAYSAVGVIEGWTAKTIDQAHEAAGLSWVSSLRLVASFAVIARIFRTSGVREMKA